ncbi:Tetratricopeptide repeat protein [anaerobic digester metagenome]
MRVMIVGTYRPEDISFEVAEGLYHPLFDSLRSMRRESLFTEIPLAELSAGDIDELLNKILGGRVHRKVLEEVMREGEGNPLFTIECVHNLLTHGQIRSEAGVWSFAGELVSVPSTVKDVVMRRVERLPRTTRRVLEAASVIGLSFEPKVLASLMNMRQMDLLEVLEEADRSHAMVKVGDGRVTFAHENLQRVIYDSMTEARRNEIHREVARILEAEPKSLRLDGEIALHHQFSGERDKCVRYSLSVGMEWLDRRAVYEAVPNFRRVLELTDGDEEFVVERLQALEGMGDCQVFLANFQEGLKDYEDFMRLGGEDVRCARVLRKIAECWSPTRLGKGSSVNCLKYLAEAEACPRINAFEEGEIFGVRTNLSLWTGDFPKADELCSRSEECFRRAGDRSREGQQLCYHAWIHLSQGDMTRALETLDRAREMYVGGKDIEQELELNRLLSEVLYHQGRGREALLAFDSVHHAASQIGDRVSMCWSHIFRTFVNLDLKESADALKNAKLALDEAMESDSAYMGCMADTVMALVALNRKDLRSALEFSEKAWKVASKFPGTVKTPVKGVTLMVRGAALCQNGNAEEGNGLFEDALRWLDGGMGCMIHLAYSLCYYGEALQRQGRSEYALDCYTRARSIFKVLGNAPGEERCAMVIGDLRRIIEGEISLRESSNLYAK